MNDAAPIVAPVVVGAAAAASWLPQIRDVASIVASLAALVVAYYAVQFYRAHKKPQ